MKILMKILISIVLSEDIFPIVCHDLFDKQVMQYLILSYNFELFK